MTDNPPINLQHQDPHPGTGVSKTGGPNDWRVIGFAVAVFSAMSVWMAVASDAFLEGDCITHYLARRFAFEQPLHLIGVWVRPLCVTLYALPAHFGGLIGTRITSLILVLIMLAITLVVNRSLKLTRPALVAIFLLTQPLLFAHSFSELTEIPFALLLIGAFWAYVRKQFLLLACLAAISPLARPEGFGLILVTLVALIGHGRLRWTVVLPLGLIGWSWLGWHVYGGPSEYPWWRWLPQNWPYSGDSVYGRGSAFRFIGVLPAVIGPMAFPLIWIGAWEIVTATVQRPWKSHVVRQFLSDHDYRCQALVAIVPLGILFGHSLLWVLGKMASNGEPRYMLIVAPFWALLAGIGWAWVCQKVKIAKPVRWTVFAALIPIAANIYYPAFPMKPAIDDRLAIKIADWIDANPDIQQDHPMLAAALPHLFIRLDRDRLDKARVVDSSIDIASNPPAGVMLVWDKVYSLFNSDARYVVPEPLLIEHGWRAVARIEEKDRYAIIYLSPEPAK